MPILRRNERALRVIRNLRFRQKRYSQKIDILCRDIVGAHSDFVEKLSIMTFSLQFQESLLGLKDVCGLLDTAVEFFHNQLHGTCAAVFMIETNGFDIHFASPAEGLGIEKAQFESWFSPQLVNEISRSRQVCDLNKLLAMGLQASPNALKHISLAAIPLGQISKTIGFVLLYRPVQIPYTAQELCRVTAVMPALRIAIQRLQAGAVKPACGPIMSS